MSARKLDIRVAKDADDDLKSIAMYTSQHWGEEQAILYEAMIGKSLESLREHPCSGLHVTTSFPAAAVFG
jgi:plasmid stabilization system protein ParE